MITRDEVNALAVLLQRLPMSLPERLWAGAFLERLSALAEAVVEAEQEGREENDEDADQSSSIRST